MDMLLLERTQLYDTLCGFSTDCGMQEAEMTIPFVCLPVAVA